MVLIARDEKRGTDATSMLHNTGLTNVVFHQLDVLDSVNIESLAKFIKDRFGRLDILVSIHFQERPYKLICQEIFLLYTLVRVLDDHQDANP